MRFLGFALLFVLLPVCVMSQSRADDIRAFSYDGNFEALEAAFAQAHEQSLTGELEFDELRDLVSAIATSHPTFFETINQWLVAYPQSPYANAVRAFQYRTTGWNIRGSGPARQKPRDALALFSEYQNAAAEHAMIAYQAAPDYVPASDAIFRLQPATKMVPRLAYLVVVAKVMETTPNLGSLERAAGFAEPGWGGRGLEDVRLLCETHAEKVPDPDYDVDICVVQLSYASGWRGGELPRIWQNIRDRTHPSIAYAWAYRVTAGAYERRAAHDIAVVQDYLTGAGQTDYEVAERFMQSFDVRGPEPQRILTDLAQRLMAEARKEIEHDPFNPQLIRVLLREPRVLQMNINEHLDESRSDAYRILRSRLAVARPFDPDIWLSVASSYSNDIEEVLSNRAMPYFQNALYYSDHNVYTIEKTLFYLIDRLATTHYTRNPGDPDVRVVDSMPADLVCEFVRLDRIATHQCRGDGLGPDRCMEVIKEFRPNYERYVSEAAATGLCSAEISQSIADLRHQPATILLQQLAKPLNWD